MIISHKYKIVFSFPTKVGSSSAQASIINSGILTNTDVFSSYRDSVHDMPKPGQNMNGVVCADIRIVSNHKIPEILGVPETGELPLVRHATPEEMYLLRFLNDKQVNEYTFFCFVREPIKRFISAYCFGRALKKEPITFTGLINWIESEHLAYPFLGKRLDDYTKINGIKINNLVFINNETLDLQLAEILNNYGGIFTPYKFKSEYAPAWTKIDYKFWLSKTHINILRKLMFSDYELYEAIK